MFFKLEKSIAILYAGFKFSRLFVEDPGVKGSAWFAKRRESSWHIFATVLRLLIALIFAPLYLCVPFSVSNSAYEWFKKGWNVEFANTPDALLHKAPSDGKKGSYEVTGHTPRWLLKVEFRGGEQPDFVQVPWSEDIRAKGYMAISYPMDSAYVLFQEAGQEELDPPPSATRRWSLRDRKRIAEQVLVEYARARARSGVPDGFEYIWLDEFCVSDDNGEEEPTGKTDRNKELGQLTDIFRGAKRVCVFCDEIGCDHTSLTCRWGTRIFTIGEILYTPEVLRMTRTRGEKGVVSELYPESAYAFKAAMQRNAALGKRWHLYAVMQHANNSGAVSWQAAIQALVVEAIRRDEAGGFAHHNYLGKALNGLLPRRARLEDIAGKDGWADLAWLLELNQGFYNAAGLAAVCSQAENNVVDHRWLGKPIAPAEGNERLEPIVTAFPVSNTRLDEVADSSLCVMSPETVVLADAPRRDPGGLYNNKDMRGLKIFAVILVLILFIVGLAIIPTNLAAGVAILYISCVLFTILELMVGTVFLVRDGWVCLDDAEWGYDMEKSLCEQDRNLQTFTHWGERQLIPTWDPPRTETTPIRNVTLVDLGSKVMVKAAVTDRPNAMIALAVHGSGITCLLLNRPDDLREVAPKVGIANLPPYILAQAHRSGSVYIGGISRAKGPETLKDKLKKGMKLVADDIYAS